MTTKRTVTTTDLDAIREEVVSSYDQENKVHKEALETWMKNMEQYQDLVRSLDVIHQMSSPEVLEAVKAYFRAEIDENICIHEAKVSTEMRRMAHHQIEAALVLHEGIFITGQKADIIPECLVVVKECELTDSILEERIIWLMKKRADGAALDDELLHEAGLPALIMRQGVFAELFRSVEQFLEIKGDVGQAFLKQICTDPKIARATVENEDCHEALHIIARLSIKHHKRFAVPGPQGAGGIGFAAAS